jgi:16S rRNA (adenine1518-N6/adenine1519-N6)-dimethyltransferase
MGDKTMSKTRNRLGWPPPKKSLGQVMLVDSEIACEIVSLSEFQRGADVLEVGPGRGIITELLLQSGFKIVGCEIDGRMVELLNKRFVSNPNFSLLQEDILKLDLERIFPGESFSVIGNLPYHLTSEILFKFFDYVRRYWDDQKIPRVQSLVIMVQKEVAERLLTAPNSRLWGVLSVHTRLHSETKHILEVPADCFKPRPHIDSTVVKLTFRSDYPCEINDYQLFRKVVKTAFNQRRKMLKNTLSHFNLQDSLNIDLTRRPETLSVEEFAYITNRLANQYFRF